MNEKLLQYLWNYKLFKDFNFVDIEGNTLEIINFGKWNHNSGPDFLFATIKSNGITSVGNIELHIKSSDWNAHQHEYDRNFDNVILHVVYENDVNISSLQKRNIPTLELKNHILPSTILHYERLQHQHSFIPCESIFTIHSVPFQFEEENVLKKLDEKTTRIQEDLLRHKNNFEAVLFQYLAYNFGLKINAEVFYELAESIDFKIILKISKQPHQLEALLFGLCGWLEDPKDETTKIWKREFDFLQSKFSLPARKFSPHFLRLRPQNFPTIRLSQFANLYEQHQNVFSKLIHSLNINEIVDLLESIHASEYWNTHYTFGKISTNHDVKKLSKDYIHSIIINTILPFKYLYYQFQKEDINDEILELYRRIPSEKNSIITQWKKLGFSCKNGLQSQALLYQYKHFCTQKKCLNCSIGLKLLKRE